jgi:putative oxidoreductase
VKWLDRIQPLALLVLRLVLGAIMVAHGYSKVFGGMSHHVQTVHNLGLPGWLAYLSAGAEFIGGLMVLLGLATRIGAALIFFNLLVAIWKVHLHQGLKGGLEFPLSVAAIAFALIFFGGGPISVEWLWRGKS